MNNYLFRLRTVLILSVIGLSFFFTSHAFGETPHRSHFNSPFLFHVEFSSQQKLQEYHKDIQQQLQKSRDLLKDMENTVHARSSEEQENLKRKMMKLNKEVEHAQRVYDKFDTIEAKDWLRDKAEVDAVMANLDVAYDEILPILRDKTRYLQEAVHHAKLAKNFGEEKRGNLFLKNTEKAKQYAALAQEEGLDSELITESLSQLKDAVTHINEDNVGAATTLIEGAYLHLNTAFKQQKNLQ